MYPGTIINWIDESGIDTSVAGVTEYENAPLFLVASSFDKGPEEMIRVKADTFYDYYGANMYFSRHGQAAIQAARIVDAGGELLVKRVVAADSTLDNIIFCLNLGTTTTQATDDEGNLLYLDDEGNQTTEVTEEIVVGSTATSLNWTATSVENCTTYEEVIEQAAALVDTENGVYPLIVVTDNGRGDTGKAVGFTTSSEVSISLGTTFYTVASYEGSTRIEQASGTINSVIYQNQNYQFNEFTMNQLKMYVDSTTYLALVSALATALGVTEDEVKTYDLIRGLTCKGASIDGLELDADSLDLTATYGIELDGGSNGEFGTRPVNTDAWTEALIEFFSGEYTNVIYDLDENHICFCCDACYPYEVKDAIAELATFREDFFFFRDMCLDVHNYSDAVSIKNEYFTTYANRYIGDYLTYYQIYDPYTLKRIEVTMMYDMVYCLVNHHVNNVFSPLAGLANSFILTSAIEGTINFTPRITPTINQKELLDDARINYAVFHNTGQCVVQSLYTSQEAYTQLSYINNVIAIQEVVRVVRDTCPKLRYTFTSGSDFSDYAESVQNVLNGYASYFDTLAFTYTQDTLLAAQKIFYASIKFSFKNWAQTEIFDVYAIQSESLATDE